MKNLIALITLLFVGIQANAQVPGDSTLSFIKRMPVFSGCNDSKLSDEARDLCSKSRLAEYVRQNVVYPDSARKKRVEGSVIVRFTVSNDGEVTEPFLLHDIGADCGQEALRVVKNMPKWEPAQGQDGAIPFQFDMPIRFNISDAEDRFRKKIFTVTWGQAFSNVVSVEELSKMAEDSVVVRDAYGDTYKVEAMEIEYEHNTTVVNIKNEKGVIDKPMRKLLRKVRRGSLLTIYATVQDGSGRVDAARTFHIL